jgi:hypothetical protein
MECLVIQTRCISYSELEIKASLCRICCGSILNFKIYFTKPECILNDVQVIQIHK